MKNNHQQNITVFEYDYLSNDNRAENTSNSVYKISTAAFEYLHACLISDEHETNFLSYKKKSGMTVFQVQNYAGVVRCPDGTQIEILPKIAKRQAGDNQKDTYETARLSLLMMLKSLKSFRHIQTGAANIKQQKMPLLEIFIAQFLESVNHLVKRGLKSDYVTEQNNNAFLRGKLLHTQQLKRNFIHKHRFFTEYDTYVADTPTNRIIHTALSKVNQYTRHQANSRLSQELMFAFDEVSFSTDLKRDFASATVQRGMQHYEQPIKWSKLIIEGLSPHAMSGSNEAFSLLFPMESVFESFVAKYLFDNLPPNFSLSTQLNKESLVTYGDKGYFRLKPDLYLTTPSGGKIVMDTKWKLINQNKSSGSDKFDLSQSDFYQMLAYGYKYLDGKGTLVLIYPKTSDFERPFAHPFRFDKKEKLSLYVLPFDLTPNTRERITWAPLSI